MKGGQRQEGGFWGRMEEEDFIKPFFIFSQQASQLSLCVMDWLPAGYDLFLGEEGSFLVESENFVSSIVYFLDSIVVIVRSAKVLAR